MEFINGMVELSSTGVIGSIFKFLGSFATWAEAVSKLIGLI